MDPLALLKALLEAGASNAGGTALALVLIGWLFYRLHHCEKRHAEAEDHGDRLAAVVVELHGAVAVLSGRRLVDLEDLESLLRRGGPAKSAVKYQPRKGEESHGTAGTTAAEGAGGSSRPSI